MKAVTQWFVGEKPEHIGVYQRKYPNVGILYSRWNGSAFSLGYHTAEEAYKFGNINSHLQNIPWRGLAEKPA
jgi:hypothetical protein